MVVLVLAALYQRFEGAYADSIYLVAVLIGLVIFIIRFFSSHKAKENYVNKAYLRIIYALFVVLLIYSLMLNTLVRMAVSAELWRIIDLVAVFSVGALSLFALSNLSRVVRTLRSKEVDKTKPFYVSMVLRIVCFLLMIHLPTYAPSYRAKPIRNLAVSSNTVNIAKMNVVKLDSLINDFNQEIAAQGVSVYLKNGNQSYEAHAGIINKRLQRRPKATDYYQIASVSKVFTATLLADFLKEGKIDSQTVLSDIYDDASEWTGEMGDVSLLSLATHTSGLPRLSPAMITAALKNFLNPYSFYNDAAFSQDLASVKPSTSKDFEYSNFGYSVLGQAIVKASGMEYLDGRALLNNFKVRVATPFGMEKVAIANEILKNDAVYASSTLKNGKSIPRWTNGQILGAGTFLASLNDLKAFVNSYLAEHLQPDFGKNYTTWWATQFVKIELPNSNRTQRLGWVEQPFKLNDGTSVSLFWHNGATFGNTSFVAFIPEMDLSIVALSNTGKNVDPLAIDLLKVITAAE